MFRHACNAYVHSLIVPLCAYDVLTIYDDVLCYFIWHPSLLAKNSSSFQQKGLYVHTYVCASLCVVVEFDRYYFDTECQDVFLHTRKLFDFQFSHCLVVKLGMFYL